ncbi:MAG: hypothetical protein V5A34_07730 [Halapricum sp.]
MVDGQALLPLISNILFIAIIVATVTASIYWKNIISEDDAIKTASAIWNPIIVVSYPFKISWYYLQNPSEDSTPPESRAKRMTGTLVIAGVTSLITSGAISPVDAVAGPIYFLISYPAGIIIGYFLTTFRYRNAIARYRGQ